MQDDVVVALYGQNRRFGEFDLGVDLAKDSDVRVGIRTGHVDVELQVGDPLLPSISGPQTELVARWRYDGQDSPVVPTSGRRTVVTLRHFLESPDVQDNPQIERTNDDVTQLELVASSLWSSSSSRNRFFMTLGAGSSFDGDPLPTDQFPLGFPFRLGAFDIGERRGDHYYVLSGGYLREVGRLPDFLGGPIFGGAWLENGSAFNAFNADEFEMSTHLGVGMIVETAIGPALASVSVGFDGHHRFYFAIGRLFP